MSVTLALGWSLQRPWALWGLAFVALVVLLSLQRRRPRSVPLGTARLFHGESVQDGAKARRWLSAARIAAIAALVSGTIALAGPRRVAERNEGEVVLALLDRTPSMFLPIDGSRASGRRVDAAIASCREWARSRSQERGLPVRVVWADASSTDAYRETSDAPDPWLVPPSIPARPPIWGAHDRSGVAWITDRMPAERPARAGVFASGGDVAPGLVAVDSGGGWLTTGVPSAPLVRDPSVSPATVGIGPTLPLEIAALAGIWAKERGLAVADPAGPDPTALRLAGPPESGSGDLLQVTVGRDGWSAEAVVDDRGAAGPGAVWLVAAIATAGEPNGSDGAGRSLPVVTSVPGRVDVLLREISIPKQRAAEFAVSWSSLFDAARVLPPGVVSQDERAAAGTDGLVPPTPIDRASSVPPFATGSDDAATATGDDEALARLAARDARREARRLQIALSAAAGLLGLLAAGLRLRGSV